MSERSWTHSFCRLRNFKKAFAFSSLSWFLWRDLRRYRRCLDSPGELVHTRKFGFHFVTKNLPAQVECLKRIPMACQAKRKALKGLESQGCSELEFYFTHRSFSRLASTFSCYISNERLLWIRSKVTLMPSSKPTIDVCSSLRKSVKDNCKLKCKYLMLPSVSDSSNVTRRVYKAYETLANLSF